MDGDALYLHQVDESSEYCTSKHVVFFRLFPEQGKVLNQAAYVWSDLTQKNKRVENKMDITVKSPLTVHNKSEKYFIGN